MPLETIESPRDLQKLGLDDLIGLCEEIRGFLIDTVSKTGGHLASNLGAVELTVALHYVFRSPKDKIFWDVGHQTYVHKLLTGRRKAFETLRRFGGLSGFPEPDESPHDPFCAGHASTAISAALGYCKARDLKGERYRVAAVVGDGSLSGGLAFEGMNNAGRSDCEIS